MAKTFDARYAHNGWDLPIIQAVKAEVADQGSRNPLRQRVRLILKRIRTHEESQDDVIEGIFGAAYPAVVVGRVAMATGAVALASVFLAVMGFVFDRRFARAGDALGAIAGVLSAGLAMLIFPEVRAIEPQAAEVAFALAVAGGFVAALGAILSATEATSWFLAQMYVGAGYALIGTWLIMTNLAARSAHIFPNRAVSVGLLAGAVMALGAASLPALLAGVQSERSAPWVSRHIGRAGYLGWSILYPLWCFWLGQSRL